MKKRHPRDTFTTPDGTVYTLGKHDTRERRSVVITRRFRLSGSQLDLEITAPKWVSWDELPAELFGAPPDEPPPDAPDEDAR
jgi:hypothetical protein